MRSVQYGSTVINYSILPKEGLKTHYISVDKDSGVVLKGKEVAPPKADKLILKKARWIMDKLRLIGIISEEEVVTGSRIPYLGKSYYTVVVYDSKVQNVSIEFNHSKFIIRVRNNKISQEDIKEKLQIFYKAKAVEKITSRIIKYSNSTGLKYRSVRFIKMNKRWGSCSSNNSIIFNTAIVKLPYSLIDYIILHELSHVKVKDHSKAFWAELSMHCSNWKMLDDKLKDVKM